MAVNLSQLNSTLDSENNIQRLASVIRDTTDAIFSTLNAVDTNYNKNTHEELKEGYDKLEKKLEDIEKNTDQYDENETSRKQVKSSLLGRKFKYEKIIQVGEKINRNIKTITADADNRSLIYNLAELFGDSTITGGKTIFAQHNANNRKLLYINELEVKGNSYKNVKIKGISLTKDGKLKCNGEIQLLFEKEKGERISIPQIEKTIEQDFEIEMRVGLHGKNKLRHVKKLRLKIDPSAQHIPENMEVESTATGPSLNEVKENTKDRNIEESYERSNDSKTINVANKVYKKTTLPEVKDESDQTIQTQFNIVVSNKQETDTHYIIKKLPSITVDGQSIQDIQIKDPGITINKTTGECIIPPQNPFLKDGKPIDIKTEASLSLGLQIALPYLEENKAKTHNPTKTLRIVVKNPNPETGPSKGEIRENIPTENYIQEEYHINPNNPSEIDLKDYFYTADLIEIPYQQSTLRSTFEFQKDNKTNLKGDEKNQITTLHQVVYKNKKTTINLPGAGIQLDPYSGKLTFPEGNPFYPQEDFPANGVSIKFKVRCTHPYIENGSHKLVDSTKTVQIHIKPELGTDKQQNIEKQRIKKSPFQESLTMSHTSNPKIGLKKHFRPEYEDLPSVEDEKTKFELVEAYPKSENELQINGEIITNVTINDLEIDPETGTLTLPQGTPITNSDGQPIEIQDKGKTIIKIPIKVSFPYKKGEQIDHVEHIQICHLELKPAPINKDTKNILEKLNQNPTGEISHTIQEERSTINTRQLFFQDKDYENINRPQEHEPIFKLSGESYNENINAYQRDELIINGQRYENVVFNIANFDETTGELELSPSSPLQANSDLLLIDQEMTIYPNNNPIIIEGQFPRIERGQVVDTPPIRKKVRLKLKPSKAFEDFEKTLNKTKVERVETKLIPEQNTNIELHKTCFKEQNQSIPNASKFKINPSVQATMPPSLTIDAASTTINNQVYSNITIQGITFDESTGRITLAPDVKFFHGSDEIIPTSDFRLANIDFHARLGFNEGGAQHHYQLEKQVSIEFKIEETTQEEKKKLEATLSKEPKLTLHADLSTIPQNLETAQEFFETKIVPENLPSAGSNNTSFSLQGITSNGNLQLKKVKIGDENYEVVYLRDFEFNSNTGEIKITSKNPLYLADTGGTPIEFNGVLKHETIKLVGNFPYGPNKDDFITREKGLNLSLTPAKGSKIKEQLDKDEKSLKDTFTAEISIIPNGNTQGDQIKNIHEKFTTLERPIEVTHNGTTEHTNFSIATPPATTVGSEIRIPVPGVAGRTTPYLRIQSIDPQSGEITFPTGSPLIDGTEEVPIEKEIQLPEFLIVGSFPYLENDTIHRKEIIRNCKLTIKKPEKPETQKQLERCLKENGSFPESINIQYNGGNQQIFTDHQFLNTASLPPNTNTNYSTNPSIPIRVYAEIADRKRQVELRNVTFDSNTGTFTIPQGEILYEPGTTTPIELTQPTKIKIDVIGEFSYDHYGSTQNIERTQTMELTINPEKESDTKKQLEKDERTLSDNFNHSVFVIPPGSPSGETIREVYKKFTTLYPLPSANNGSSSENTRFSLPTASTSGTGYQIPVPGTLGYAGATLHIQNFDPNTGEITFPSGSPLMDGTTPIQIEKDTMITIPITGVFPYLEKANIEQKTIQKTCNLTIKKQPKPHTQTELEDRLNTNGSFSRSVAVQPAGGRDQTIYTNQYFLPGGINPYTRPSNPSFSTLPPHPFHMTANINGTSTNISIPNLTFNPNNGEFSLPPGEPIIDNNTGNSIPLNQSTNISIIIQGQLPYDDYGTTRNITRQQTMNLTINPEREPEDVDTIRRSLVGNNGSIFTEGIAINPNNTQSKQLGNRYLSTHTTPTTNLSFLINNLYSDSRGYYIDFGGDTVRINRADHTGVTMRIENYNEDTGEIEFPSGNIFEISGVPIELDQSTTVEFPIQARYEYTYRGNTERLEHNRVCRFTVAPATEAPHPQTRIDLEAQLGDEEGSFTARRQIPLTNAQTITTAHSFTRNGSVYLPSALGYDTEFTAGPTNSSGNLELHGVTINNQEYDTVVLTGFTFNNNTGTITINPGHPLQDHTGADIELEGNTTLPPITITGNFPYDNNGTIGRVERRRTLNLTLTSEEVENTNNREEIENNLNRGPVNIDLYIDEDQANDLPLADQFYNTTPLPTVPVAGGAPITTTFTIQNPPITLRNQTINNVFYRTIRIPPAQLHINNNGVLTIEQHTPFEFQAPDGTWHHLNITGPLNISFDIEASFPYDDNGTLERYNHRKTVQATIHPSPANAVNTPGTRQSMGLNERLPHATNGTEFSEGGYTYEYTSRGRKITDSNGSVLYGEDINSGNMQSRLDKILGREKAEGEESEQERNNRLLRNLVKVPFTTINYYFYKTLLYSAPRAVRRAALRMADNEPGANPRIREILRNGSLGRNVIQNFFKGYIKHMLRTTIAQQRNPGGIYIQHNGNYYIAGFDDQTMDIQVAHIRNNPNPGNNQGVLNGQQFHNAISQPNNTIRRDHIDGAEAQNRLFNNNIIANQLARVLEPSRRRRLSASISRSLGGRAAT